MMTGSDHSDTVSLETSWPASPKRSVPAYYVQSPSRDSHDEDKSSNQGTTPTSIRSPTDSPAPNYYWSSLFGGRHSSDFNSNSNLNSRESSASRVSGRKRPAACAEDRQRWWVIDEDNEEEKEREIYLDSSRGCQVLGGLIVFVSLFSLFCLVIWGASRPFVPQISVKSLIVHEFHTGEGSDFTGIPTRMLTVNASLVMTVHNPATFFSIHLRSSTFDLMYYDLIVASGQMKGFHQGRKSMRHVRVNIEGKQVPLYGAGAGFASRVPLKLVFEVWTKGYVVGKLVKSKHRLHVSCSFIINTRNPSTVRFHGNSCQYH